MSKQIIAAGVQVAGGVCLAVAAFLVAVVAGFVVCGVVLIVFGIALEPAAPSADASPVPAGDVDVDADPVDGVLG